MNKLKHWFQKRHLNLGNGRKTLLLHDVYMVRLLPVEDSILSSLPCCELVDKKLDEACQDKGGLSTSTDDLSMEWFRNGLSFVLFFSKLF
jgi:hypothetical protein